MRNMLFLLLAVTITWAAKTDSLIESSDSVVNSALPVLSTEGSSESVLSAFEQANALYDEQRFDSASLFYSAAIQTEGESSVIYFNLGNCSYRMGRIGEALLYNEKALKFDSDDEQIIANIAFLRTQIVDEIPLVDSNPLSDGVNFLHHLFSLETELWIVFALSVVFVTFVMIALFKGGSRRIWSIYIAGALFVIGLVVGGSASMKIYRIETERFAIVLSETAEARSEPTGGQLIFSVHEGTKLKINSAQGSWMFVSLPNGASGYIKASSVGEI